MEFSQALHLHVCSTYIIGILENEIIQTNWYFVGRVSQVLVKLHIKRVSQLYVHFDRLSNVNKLYISMIIDFSDII